MALDRRAVALQGIGFGRKLVALRGLLEVEQVDQEDRPNWLRVPERRPRKRRHEEEEALLLMVLGN